MELEKDEVIDFSGEKFSSFSIPCSIGLFIMLFAAIINMIIMVAFPGTFLSIYISLGIIIIFVLYYSYLLTQNPGKIRKFAISSEEIEFTLPNIPIFIIKWTDFEKIEIRMKKLELKPFILYEFHFMKDNSDKTFDISLFHFHREKIDQILILLKDYSNKMKKEFKAVQETIVSGIVEVEDLKI
ncbi:MAG: hypothetical protein JSV62_08185 [Promethearchaeota archaeon]|nr:MAG: hypothetical protein JSV62_08185 [Candidatus Lokiarchaeota archaeon]